MEFYKETMSDAQLKEVYDTVIAKGADNYLNAISDDYDSMKKLVKQGKEIPPYTADWYKSYIYTNVPALAEIKNKNIYLLGAVDILFTMFDACLTEKLCDIIKNAEKI